MFAAASGSSIATAASIGTVAIPEMTQRGYDKKLLFGSLAAGGTLGILIPPSITMILYGLLTEQSVALLFMAGLFPGLLLALLFNTYILVRAVISPKLAPQLQEKASWSARLSGLKDLLGIGPLIGLVLGGIYLGLATPTEAASLGAIGSVVLALTYRRLTWEVIRKSLLSAVSITGMVTALIFGAQIVTAALGALRVPAYLMEWVSSSHLPPLLVLVAIYVMYLIMGCFIDTISMVVLTVPITVPAITALGWSPIWFGVIITLLSEAGLITPPVGANVFVIHGVSKGGHLSDVFRGAAPFVGIMVVALAIFTAFPEISLWLPSQM